MASRRPTKVEYLQRLAAAEELIGRSRWSIYDRLELAQRFGVELDTVNAWGDRVKQMQVERLRKSVSDPELARAELLHSIETVKAVFIDAAERSGGKGSIPAPLVKLIEFEAKVRGVTLDPTRVEVTHTGRVSVDVQLSNADPVARARAVLQSVPDACSVLGIPAPDLPTLEALNDGLDLLEAVEVEVIDAEFSEVGS